MLETKQDRYQRVKIEIYTFDDSDVVRTSGGGAEQNAATGYWEVWGDDLKSW